MKKYAFGLSMTVFVISLALLVLANPSHFPGARTAAPGESNCAACHGTLNNGHGFISIVTSQSPYVPGDTATITVKVKKSGQRRWGFQLTPLGPSMQRAGTLIDIDTSLTHDTILAASGRNYLWQTEAGTFADNADSAVWTCRWVSPKPGTGPVTLFACGVAADNDNTASGDYSYSTFIIVPQSLATAADETDPSLPDAFTLQQNYPNPFNPSTHIDYTLPRQSDVDLAVYNITGQWVATLVHGRQISGQHSVDWNGVDGAGQPVASGTYLYRLRTDDFVVSKKMMLVK